MGSRSPTSLCATVTCFLLVLTSSPAFAQDDDAQLAELNQAGVAALDRGEYERAVRFFQEAVEAKPLNVIYLNLGRAYARWGKCDQARAAYDQVPDAPAAESPPRDTVLEVLYRYRLELDEQCAKQESNETEVEATTRTPIERPPADEPMSLRPVALGLIGVGAAALATGLVIEFAVLPRHERQQDEEAFRSTRGANQAIFVGGAVFAAAGAVLWFLDPGRSATALRPVVGGDRVGLAWEVRW